MRLKHLGILAGCLALAACGSVTVPNDPAQTVYAMEGSLTALIQAATVYEQEPTCGAGVNAVCSNPTVAADIKVAAQTAVAAVSAAQTAVQGGAGASAVAADVAAAQTALEALTALIPAVKS